MRSRIPPDELICAHWTFAGIQRELPFESRIRAAAAAGIRHIGWSLDAYAKAQRAGASGPGMRRFADDFGVRVSEIEFLRCWAADGSGHDLPGVNVAAMPWQEQERVLLEMAELFGADHVNIGDDGFGGAMLPWDDVVDRFTQICARAEALNLLVALEFMPWTLFPDLQSAWQLITAAGAPNAAVLLDTWHFFRGPASNHAYLDSLPADAIGLIQVNDAHSPEGDMFEDTMHRRLFPGDGEFDLDALFSTLVARGIRAPVSVEVMSEVVEAMSPAEAASRAREATGQLLSRVGW